LLHRQNWAGSILDGHVNNADTGSYPKLFPHMLKNIYQQKKQNGYDRTIRHYNELQSSLPFPRTGAGFEKIQTEDVDYRHKLHERYQILIQDPSPLL
jgi:hypothetical protein